MTNTISASVKDPSDPMGPLFIIGGDDWDNFNRNAVDMLGAEGASALRNRMAHAFLNGPLIPPQPPTPAQAVANVQAAFPQATVISGPPSQPAGYDQWAGTNAQPAQGFGQPAPAYQPYPAPEKPPLPGPPPGVQPPICECGYPRVWKAGYKKAKPNEVYKMWSCPLPQGPGQHAASWVY